MPIVSILVAFDRVDVAAAVGLSDTCDLSDVADVLVVDPLDVIARG